MKLLIEAAKRVDSVLDVVSDLVNFYFLTFVAIVIVVFRNVTNASTSVFIWFVSLIVLAFGVLFMLRSIYRAFRSLGAKLEWSALHKVALVVLFAVLNLLILVWFLGLYTMLAGAKVTDVSSILKALGEISLPAAALL